MAGGAQVLAGALMKAAGERSDEEGMEGGNIVWKWQRGAGEPVSSRNFQEKPTGLEEFLDGLLIF